MSTNHTEHYNLSLWEPSDQVTRTEFNENHTKIETALDSKVGKVVLYDITTVELIDQIDLDIGEKNWAQYNIVLMMITMGSLNPDTLTLRTENSTCSYHRTNTSGAFPGLMYTSQAGSTVTLFFPGGCLDNSIQTLSFAGGNTFFGIGPTYKNAGCIRIEASRLPVGTRIKVIGIL